MDPWIIGDIENRDDYAVGDFDNDGQAELLAINLSDGWSRTFKFDGFSFQSLDGNYGGGRIGSWDFGQFDRYLPGKFDGGSDLLIRVNPQNGWWHMMNY